MCAAREIAPVRRGGRGAFFIDLFFCYFLLSAVQKSPPQFSFCENCRFSKHLMKSWGLMSPQNDYIFIFFVLVRVRKCVELFYWNWPGLTLSSPIRFSSADRRTKSIIWNVEWREKKCKKMTNMTCYPTLSTHKMLDFSSLLVLVRVRKCVELFSPNWRGLTLSSPIRFSSADRRTKSMICNAVPSCGSDRLNLHFREGSVADISQLSEKHLPPENLEMARTGAFFSLVEIYKVWKNVKIHVIVEIWGHMLILIWEMSATDPSGEPQNLEF